MKFGQLNKEEFKEFEQAHPLGMFMQTTYQHDLVSSRGWESEYLGVKVNDQVVAAALVNSKKMFLGKLFEVSGGPVLDYSDEQLLTFFVEELKKYTKSKGGLILRLIPNLHDEAFNDEGEVVSKMDEIAKANLLKLNPVYYPSKPVIGDEFSPISLPFAFVKSLEGLADEKSLIKSYQKDGMYYLNKTKQFGISYRQLSYDEMPLFKTYTEETANRVGFPDKDLSYYQEVYQSFGDNAQFIVAEVNLQEYKNNQLAVVEKLQAQILKLEQELIEKPNNKKKSNQIKEFTSQLNQHEKRVKEAEVLMDKNGELITLAGALFIIQPQEITYLFSFTNEEFKTFYAPYGIQHKMMLLAIERGIPSYNFYGVKGVFDGSDGILRFKQSFTGRTQSYLGIFEFILNPFKQKLAQSIKKILKRV